MKNICFQEKDDDELGCNFYAIIIILIPAQWQPGNSFYKMIEEDDIYFSPFKRYLNWRGPFPSMLRQFQRLPCKWLASIRRTNRSLEGDVQDENEKCKVDKGFECT